MRWLAYHPDPEESFNDGKKININRKGWEKRVEHTEKRDLRWYKNNIIIINVYLDRIRNSEYIE